MVDLLGFSGSALFVVSATSRSVVRLRLVGLLGASFFIVYGVTLSAWPIVASNVLTSSVHTFHLFRARRASGDELEPKVRRRAVGMRRASA